MHILYPDAIKTHMKKVAHYVTEFINNGYKGGDCFLFIIGKKVV